MLVPDFLYFYRSPSFFLPCYSDSTIAAISLYKCLYLEGTVQHNPGRCGRYSELRCGAESSIHYKLLDASRCNRFVPKIA